jgi:hypothetical protein
MDAFGLAGIVVVDEQLWLLGKNWFAIIGVTVLNTTRGADDLLRWNPVDLLRVRAHEVLASAGHDIGLVSVRAQIAQKFLHRLIRQFGVKSSGHRQES